LAGEVCANAGAAISTAAPIAKADRRDVFMTHS
jgi:hypothetical protein